MKFLIVMTLAYSLIGFEPQVNAAPKVSGAGCTSYLRMAMMEPLSELSSESATHKYLQYLGYFIEQHYLSVDNLRSLLGFSTVPHLLNLFEAQIPESFVYRSDFEKFLPLVELEKVKAFLNVFITAQTKETELKETAFKEEANVIGFYPLIKRVIHGRAIDNKTYFIKDALNGPLVVEPMAKLIWNLKTGDSIPFEDGLADQIHIRVRTHAIHVVGNETFLVRELDGSSEWREGFSLNDLNNGHLLFQIQSQGRITQITPFKNENSDLSVAWFEDSSDGQFAKVKNLVTGKESAVKMKATVNINFSKWILAPEGGLFFYYEAKYIEKGPLSLKFLESESKKITVFDMVKNEVIFEENLGLSERVLELSRINPEYYTLYIPSPYNATSYTPDKIKHVKKSQAAKWKSEDVALKVKFQSKSGLITLKLADGEFYLVDLGHEGDPLQILRIKDHEVKKIEMRGEKKLIYKPDGTPVVVSVKQKQSKATIFTIVDLETYRETQLTLQDSDWRISTYAYRGSSFRPDGTLMAYFSHQELLPSEINLILPIQLYGPFNPKTGDVQPHSKP